jgi:hypothetical protein
MGALHAGRCYSTASDAALSYWSGVGPVVSTGSPPTVSTAQYYADGWRLLTHQGETLMSSVLLPTPSFAVCDPSQAALDGIAVGFAVVGVWVTAWVISILRRPLGM